MSSVTPPPIRSVVVYACDGEAEATQEDSEPVWSFVGAGEQEEYVPRRSRRVGCASCGGVNGGGDGFGHGGGGDRRVGGQRRRGSGRWCRCELGYAGRLGRVRLDGGGHVRPDELVTLGAIGEEALRKVDIGGA